MYSFNPKEEDVKNNKKMLIGAVIPRPIALVVTESDEGIINVAPFSYFNVASYDPPVLSISVQRNAAGELKDTSRNIFQGKEAVVHIVDEGIVDEANKTSASLDPATSELTLADFTLVDSLRISPPGLQEARIRYETTYLSHQTISNDSHATADLILLEVQQIHISEKIYDMENRYILPEYLAPMSRLAGDDYGELGHIFTLDRPN